MFCRSLGDENIESSADGGPTREFQREAQTLPGEESLQRGGGGVWPAGAEALAVINKRPASLR